MITVAIDPGVWALGWAIFRGDLLISAGCSRVSQNTLRSADLAVAHAREIREAIYAAMGNRDQEVRVVLEAMRTRGPDARQRPDDLIAVTEVGCLTASRLGHVDRLYPAAEWKGSVPKDIHHPRIRACLRPDEQVIADRAAVCAGKTHAKEVWDAIGLGLFYLKRMDAKGDTL